MVKWKELNREAIAEVALGIIIAFFLITFLSTIFSRSPKFNAEDAEDLENLRGKFRAKMAARRKVKHKKKMAAIRRAKAEGKAKGEAGEEDYEDDEAEPVEEEEAEDLEQAEDAEDAEDAEELEEA